MRARRWACVALLLMAPVVSGATETHPSSEPLETQAALREQRAALKSLQAELLLEEARAEWNERRARLGPPGRNARKRPERRRPASNRSRSGTPGARARPAELLPFRSAPLASAPPLGKAPDVLSINRRVTPAPSYWTQSEVGLASIGRNMVAAWNDGTLNPVSGQMSYSTSTDGGQTWRPSASLPLGGGLVSWDSDPVFVADPAHGAFWFAALALVAGPPTRNAIGFMRGSFSDTGFVWERIGFARATRDTLPDKPWIAVDSRDGAAMLSYTSFYRVGPRLTDRIEFQRTTDGGANWSPPSRLSAPEEEGLVQGSRPVVGPDGEVHVVWALVDTSDFGRGLDQIRIRTSHDGGLQFEAPITLAREVTNFATGAPGYNRPYAINFPSVAVDRSHGPYRGRVYVAWMESADFYAAPLGTRSPVIESGTQGEPTDFEIGAVLRGTSVPGQGLDVFRFMAHRGDNMLVMLDSLGDQVDLALGVGCEEDAYQLAYSDPPHFGRPRVALVSFSRDGPYTLSVAARGTTTSGYRIRTGAVSQGASRGRDVRDVFVTHSQDGVSWSTPSRVNEAPPGTDDWLPELAVGPEGHVYAAWYDWSDSPAGQCGALSNTRLARSVDGGSLWQRLGTLSDRASAWTSASSNLVPNQGDYIGLTVDTLGVAAGWADARGATPDIYFAQFDPALLPARPVTRAGVSLGAPRPNPAQGELRVAYTAQSGVPARVELWDIAGRRIEEQVVASPFSSAEMKVVLPAGLSAGVYLLRFTQGAASATARVVLIP